jgi:hypothetical protein
LTVAVRKSKQPTTRNQPSPPLDDPRWVSLILAHHIRSEQLTGDRLSDDATVELMEVLKSGKLRCMVRNSADPSERKLVPASFWQDHRILLIDGYLQIRGKSHGPGKGVCWDFFGWKPDIDTLWPAGRPGEETEVSPRRKPGPPPRHEWPLVVAAELIRRAKAGEKEPTAAEMIEHCENTFPDGFSPGLKEMQVLLQKLLLGKF